MPLLPHACHLTGLRALTRDLGNKSSSIDQKPVKCHLSTCTLAGNVLCMYTKIQTAVIYDYLDNHNKLKILIIVE